MMLNNRRRSVFGMGGTKPDYRAKIEHTYMTNFVCICIKILYKNTVYLGGGVQNDVLAPTIYDCVKGMN